ncbi:MAG: hypothetical protein WA753_09020, partial [Pseudolabrys sp.]
PKFTEAASVMHLRRDSAKKVHTLGKKINAERQADSASMSRLRYCRRGDRIRRAMSAFGT